MHSWTALALTSSSNSGSSALPPERNASTARAVPYTVAAARPVFRIFAESEAGGGGGDDEGTLPLALLLMRGESSMRAALSLVFEALSNLMALASVAGMRFEAFLRRMPVNWLTIPTSPQNIYEAYKLVISEALDVANGAHPTQKMDGMTEDDRFECICDFERTSRVMSILVSENIFSYRTKPTIDASEETLKCFGMEDQKRLIFVWDYVRCKRLRLERPRDRGCFYRKMVLRIALSAEKALHGFRRQFALGVLRASLRRQPGFAAFWERAVQRAWMPGGAAHLRLVKTMVEEEGGVVCCS